MQQKPRDDELRRCRGHGGPARLAWPVALLLGLSGCGNSITTDIVGSTGITVTPEGDPVAVIAVCREYVDLVQVSEGREGLSEDEVNPEVGDWTSTKEQTGLVQVALLAPEPPWEGPGAVRFEPDKTYIVGAGAGEQDISAGQVAFVGVELAHLRPGTIYLQDGIDGPLKGGPLKDFLGQSCEKSGQQR